MLLVLKARYWHYIDTVFPPVGIRTIAFKFAPIVP